MRGSYKINDTLTNSAGSRLDHYWSGKSFEKFYKLFRRGKSLPPSFHISADNQKSIIKKFHLRGFQFGNWVTVEDRYNYLAALYICLNDLEKVMRFKNNNIGLSGLLGISFGARGSSGAVAHYESNTNIINLTRYSDGQGTKKSRFIYSGGVGSFAHEYGHFIDFVFGMYYDQSKTSTFLSGGRSINKRTIIYKTDGPRKRMEALLKKVFWKDEKKGIESNYMKRLQKQTKKEYWFRRTEVFARVFEQYVSFKLQKAKVYNSFLSESKYEPSFYLNPSEVKAIVPLMDKLLTSMRKYF